jgi:hypothetical protein
MPTLGGQQFVPRNTARPAHTVCSRIGRMQLARNSLTLTWVSVYKWVANRMPESTEIESIVEPVKVSASAPANRRVEDVLAFNPQLTCLEPWFDQLIDAVVQEVSALPGKPTVKATHRRCLRPILANLCKAQRSKQSLAIARDKNAYGFPKPYNPARLTHLNVIFCLDHLEASGLVTIKKGSYDKDHGARIPKSRNRRR